MSLAGREAGTNPIDALFHDLRRQNRTAFIPFLTAGDPDLAGTGRLLEEVARRGANLVEIGFPYSDPIADGAVIQASYSRALEKGLRTEQIFEYFEQLAVHKSIPVPLVAMISYSLVLRRGSAVFVERAKTAGFSGALVPDLPIEESDALARIALEHDFKLIQMITPMTPTERAVEIARQSTGFIYYVSVTGITGVRQDLSPQLREQLQWLREQTDLPICVGFGISRAEQVAMLKDVADGIIVGSAIVRKLEQAGAVPFDRIVSEVGALVAELSRPLAAP